MKHGKKYVEAAKLIHENPFLLFLYNQNVIMKILFGLMF